MYPIDEDDAKTAYDIDKIIRNLHETDRIKLVFSDLSRGPYYQLRSLISSIKLETSSVDGEQISVLVLEGCLP